MKSGKVRAMDNQERKPAITVKDLKKVYKLYDKPSDRFKEAFGLTRKKAKEHYALNGVSLEIFQGETVGIIGTNGSGKSTILKIITGVLSPTSGEVNVNGRISALLELGAGFNMEYNGIENVYLNGTMMGFSQKEIDAKLPEILKFADIGDYVYQPVKTYSSGMFVRLAFAVAINIDPEILVVDEAEMWETYNMDINKILSKLFGNKSTRDMKLIQPWVEKIKAAYPAIQELDNDALRAKTKEIQHTIQHSADDIKEKIDELKSKIEDTPIEDREVIFSQIDKLETQVLDKMEVALNDALPEVLAIVKDTARRFAENETIEVTANDFDRDSAGGFRHREEYRTPIY